MKKEELVEQLVKLTISKAHMEGKHPFEILVEVKRLIEQKRTMERQRIVQAVSMRRSDN